MTRQTASEKYETIRLVEEANLPAQQILDQLQVPRASFYRWMKQYQERGFDGLLEHTRGPGRIWNRIPDGVQPV